MDEVAIAGDRAAWISEFQPGNYVTQEVGIATIAPLRVHWLTDDSESGECDPYCTTAGLGDLVTNLVGHGDMLVLNSWSTCDLDPSGDPSCPDAIRLLSGKNTGYGVEAGALHLVTSAGLRRVASGPPTLYAVSVDAGRVLVLRRKANRVDVQPGADGSLAIYDSAGHAGDPLETTLRGILDARLHGPDVAVLTRDAVAVLDAGTGRTRRVWNLAGTTRWRLEDIDSGIVVCVGGNTIHLLRLRDGHQTVITAPGRTPVYAQLEPSGLFYSYVAPRGLSGRVAFIPRADLTRRFGG